VELEGVELEQQVDQLKDFLQRQQVQLTQEVVEVVEVTYVHLHNQLQLEEPEVQE